MARTTGWAGQQHARSSRWARTVSWLGSGGGLPVSGALAPAPLCGNLGFMTGGCLGSSGPSETEFPSRRDKGPAFRSAAGAELASRFRGKGTNAPTAGRRAAKTCDR